MDESRKKSLFRKLLIIFGLSYLLSNGPGIYLVNSPTLVAGIPILYLWALFWAVVQIGIILYAYFKLWRHEVEEEIEAIQDEHVGGES